MWVYAVRRLMLLPFTLFCIVLVNFIVINLAPGDPVSYAEVSAEGTATKRDDRSAAFGDERYLHFREFYGLTYPILFNTWPWLSYDYVEKALWQLVNRRESPSNPSEIPPKQYQQLRTLFGDQSRFIMPHLLAILKNPAMDKKTKRMAARYFIRGASRPGVIGMNLTESQKLWNTKISQDDAILRRFMWPVQAKDEIIQEKIASMELWYNDNALFYEFSPTWKEKISSFFLKTRFMQYMKRIVCLDFGTLRSDSNKSVISEVTKRFKYSLTLSLTPMIITFGLCQLFGLLMAYYQHRGIDYSLNLFFLVLYAIPVFVVAPFLIEKIALYHCFPFTHEPIPISGFTSSDRIYYQETSFQRLVDILQHIILPIIAIMYGSLAAQSRLSRTAILEVLRQDYVRTARAKGLPPLTIMFKHVGRNAGITIVTSLASSFGVILGGSLIVETIFDINGFGKFFYEAVVNRDYNVIMFSALAGSFLTLLGYLVADLAYMWLDPRVVMD